jgi:hypothetical protein
MISTYHGDETWKIKTKLGQEKPVFVLDYTQNIIGVYLKNGLHLCLLERKITKWYINMFRRVLSSGI